LSLLEKYDNSNITSIVNYANKLVGKTIDNVLTASKINDEINIRNKGAIGTIIEEY